MGHPDRKALSKHARRLIERCIDSIGRLDVLLLLRDEERPLSTHRIAAAVAAPAGWTEQQLRALEAGELVIQAAAGMWRYEPSEDLREVVDEVAVAWESQRATVVSLVLSVRA